LPVTCFAADRCILLLEDIEHAFQPDPDKSATTGQVMKTTNVTFSGLLNAIDGVAAQVCTVAL
jgi:hypothetical protein